MKNREVADKMGLRRENRTGSLKCHPRQGEAARPTESPMFSEGSGSEAAGGREGGMQRWRVDESLSMMLPTWTLHEKGWQE